MVVVSIVFKVFPLGNIPSFRTILNGSKLPSRIELLGILSCILPKIVFNVLYVPLG